MTEAKVLHIEALCARYERRDVLHGIDLQLQRGEWLGLVGPNGSGKSTLLACIAGRHAPASGSIVVAGSDVMLATLAAKQALGFAVDPALLPAVLTGTQCLEVFARSRKMTGPDADTLQLAQALQLQQALALPIGHYSYGMRQKLSVLLALLGDPPLLLLDEAFNGLDPRSGLVLQDALRSRVFARRCAVILATHGLNIIARCATRMALLHEGAIVRQWQGDAFAQLHAAPDGLEQALADAMASST